MRVLLVTDSFDPDVGGVREVVRELAEAFRTRGVDVTVVTRAAAGRPDSEEIGGIPVRRIRLGRPAFRLRAALGWLRRKPAATRAFREILEEFRPDVIHLHFLQSPLTWLALPIAAERGIPLVATAHGSDVTSMVEDDRLGRRIVKRVVTEAAAVTAPTRVVLDRALRVGEVLDRPNAHVVPPMLAKEMAHLMLRKPTPGDGSVVAVGALRKVKGFDVLIRATARLPGVVVRIAGEGEEHARLTALAEELGIGDRVEFVGNVSRERLVSMLVEATALAVPSRDEAFSLMVIEAFAAGLPVVASRVGGIPEAAGDAAKFVPADDPGALAAALREVLSAGAARDELVAAGRERVHRYTPAKMAERYLEIYRAAGEEV